MTKQIEFEINFSVKSPQISAEKVGQFIRFKFEAFGRVSSDDVAQRYATQLDLIGSFSTLLALGFIDAQSFEKLVNAIKKIDGEELAS